MGDEPALDAGDPLLEALADAATDSDAEDLLDMLSGDSGSSSGDASGASDEDDNPFGVSSEIGDGASHEDEPDLPDPSLSPTPSPSSSSPSTSECSGSSGESGSSSSDSADEDPAGPSLVVPFDDNSRVGVIRMTNIMGRQEFYAVCSNKAHKACVKTKTARAGPKKGQGRPLGFLSAWLRGGAACGSKADHFKCVPTLAQRQEGRALLAVMDGSADFFGFERVAGDEPDEPLVFA